MKTRIEEGCLAVIIFGDFTGTEITMGGFVGRVPEITENNYTDYWEVTDMQGGIPASTLGKIVLPVIPEKHIMRVDGFTKKDNTIEVEQQLKRRVGTRAVLRIRTVNCRCVIVPIKSK